MRLNIANKQVQDIKKNVKIIKSINDDIDLIPVLSSIKKLHSLNSKELQELLEYTNGIIALKRKDINIDISKIEKEIIEGIRVLPSGEVSKLVDYLMSLICDKNKNQ